MSGTLDGTVDVSCATGLSFEMATVSGRLGLVQALVRRLQTPLSLFPWWPNYGTDLRLFLLSKTQPSAVVAAAQAECEKEERVLRAEPTAEVSVDGTSLAMTLVITDAAGPFTFTMTITEAALTLIELQKENTA